MVLGPWAPGHVALGFFGNFGLWVITCLIVVNAFASFYGKFVAKEDTWLHEYYGHDSVFHPFFYLLGAVYTVIYTLHVSFEQFTGPEWIVSGGTGGVSGSTGANGSINSFT